MVFVRFRTGGASVAAPTQPYHAELEHYRMELMVPLDEPRVDDLEIDWRTWSRTMSRMTIFRSDTGVWRR